MPRVVKEDEFAVRYNEILDTAQRLVFSKGYEQMSIQDILDELRISKGAFYHYFDSKPALLEALILRIQQEATVFIQPILEDPALPALVKLEKFFDTTARWKTANKAYMMAILRVWYQDDNAIVRQKMMGQGFQLIMPMMAEAIRQGVDEGVMEVPYIDQIGEILIPLMIGLGDATANTILSLEPGASAECREAVYQKVVKTVLAFTHAIERILGAAPGSIKFFDLDMLREWVAPLEESSPANL